MNNLFVMVGLSGSGKSTTTAEILSDNPNAIVVSSDAIREELTGDYENQEHNGEVFKVFRDRIQKGLEEGKDVIVDATNLTMKSRRSVLEITKPFDVYKSCYVVAKSFEQCQKDNINREHPVPSEVLEKQLKSFQIPFPEEGFDEIHIRHVGERNVLPNMEGFDQKNPHHTMDLQQHCDYAASLFSEADYSDAYKLGAKMHDVGKYYTQTFDEDGIAHYFNHAEVGSYQFLTAKTEMDDKKLLDTCFLINYHMIPFNWEDATEKTQRRWECRFGKDKYQMLSDFHECDKGTPVKRKEKNFTMKEYERPEVYFDENYREKITNMYKEMYNGINVEEADYACNAYIDGKNQKIMAQTAQLAEKDLDFVPEGWLSFDEEMYWVNYEGESSFKEDMEKLAEKTENLVKVEGFESTLYMLPVKQMLDSPADTIRNEIGDDSKETAKLIAELQPINITSLVEEARGREKEMEEKIEKAEKTEEKDWTNYFKQSGSGFWHYCGDITEGKIPQPKGVTDYHTLFEGTNIKNIDLSDWDVSEVRDFQGMFGYCKDLESVSLAGWEMTGGYVDMSRMFAEDRNLKEIDLTNATATPYRLNDCFENCQSLKELDLSGFKVSQTKDLGHTFANCKNLETLNMDGWNPMDARAVDYMFSGCESLKELSINDWLVDYVEHFEGMFSNDRSLRELDLSKWNPAYGKNFNMMFANCENLESVKIQESHWNIDKDKNTSVFFGSYKVKKPNIYAKDLGTISVMEPDGTIPNKVIDKTVDKINVYPKQKGFLIETRTNNFPDAEKIPGTFSVNKHGDISFELEMKISSSCKGIKVSEKFCNALGDEINKQLKKMKEKEQEFER